MTPIATPDDAATLACRIVDWVPFVPQLVTGINRRSVVVRDISNGGTPQAGAWNYKGPLSGFDPLDAVGRTLFRDSLGWHKARVDELRAL